MLPYSLFIWACPKAYFGCPIFKSWLKAWSFYIPTSLQWPLSFVPKVALWRDLNVFIHSFIYSFLCTAHLCIYFNLFIIVQGPALARSVQVHHNLIKHTAYEMSILLSSFNACGLHHIVLKEICLLTWWEAHIKKKNFVVNDSLSLIGLLK